MLRKSLIFCLIIFLIQPRLATGQELPQALIPTSNSNISPVLADLRFITNQQSLINDFNKTYNREYTAQDSQVGIIDIKILEEGWKVYYKLSGFVGFEPEFSFWSSDEKEEVDLDYNLLWPAPTRTNFLGIETFVYLSDFQIPIIINNNSNFDEGNLKLKVEIYTCKEVCLKKDFVFSLAAINNNNSQKFDNFQEVKNLPNIDEGFIKKVIFYPQINELKIELKNDYENVEDLLISSERFVFKHSLQNTDNKSYLKQIMVTPDDFANENNSNKNYHLSDQKQLHFVLLRNNQQALVEDLVVTDGKASSKFGDIICEIVLFEEQKDSIYISQAFSLKTLLLTIILAFIGGLLLNLMPCVLPILSMKLLMLSDIKYDKGNKKTLKVARSAILLNWLGIMSAFLLIAFSLALLKSLGKAYGLGLQFQNSYFLIVMIVVLNLFALSFLNLVSFRLPRKLNNYLISYKVSSKNIEHFSLGFFAVLIATPCTAPFLGSAIGYALTTDYLSLFMIFISLGFGFSMPFFALYFFPKLIRVLPKTGRWQIYLQYTLASLLLLTILYLIYILAKQMNLEYIVGLMLALTIINFAIFKQSKLKKFGFYLQATVMIVFIFTIPSFTKEIEITSTFDEKIIYDEIQKGSSVLVNVTADWCLTCKVNEFNVLSQKDVVNFFKINNIKLITLDWTLADENISNFLAKYDRYSIPFYLYLDHKQTTNSKVDESGLSSNISLNLSSGTVLPVILTKSNLFSTIKEVRLND